MKPRKSDIWVLSYPRSGTTWTQEMVWQIANKCDFEVRHFENDLFSSQMAKYRPVWRENDYVVRK